MSIMENIQAEAAPADAIPTEAAPLGWYPDPAGSHKLRLWNGAEWTNRLEREGSGVQPVYRYAEDGTITRQFDY